MLHIQKLECFTLATYFMLPVVCICCGAGADRFMPNGSDGDAMQCLMFMYTMQGTMLGSPDKAKKFFSGPPGILPDSIFVIENLDFKVCSIRVTRLQFVSSFFFF